MGSRTHFALPEIPGIDLLEKDILNDGFGVIADFKTVGTSTFLSIGFTEQNKPEILLSAFTYPDIASSVFMAVTETLNSNDALDLSVNFGIQGPAAKRIGCKLFKLTPVDPDSIAALAEMHFKRYPTGFRVMGVVFSDALGKYPGENGYRQVIDQPGYKIKYIH